MPVEDLQTKNKLGAERRLGEEWQEWDGKNFSESSEISSGIFLFLAAISILGFFVLASVVWWLILPRLHSLGIDIIGWIIFGVGIGYLILWYKCLFFAYIGIKFFKKILYKLGGINWILASALCWGKIFNFSRDQIGNAFVKISNRIQIVAGKKILPTELLVLAPRCLTKEIMQGLRGLQQRYNFFLTIAVGGSEARQAIKTRKPRAIIAIACERDLLSGIKDLRGRMTIVGVPNKRPEGPCKNTTIDLLSIEKTIKLFIV